MADEKSQLDLVIEQLKALEEKWVFARYEISNTLRQARSLAKRLQTIESLTSQPEVDIPHLRRQLVAALELAQSALGTLLGELPTPAPVATKAQRAKTGKVSHRSSKKRIGAPDIAIAVLRTMTTQPLPVDLPDALSRAFGENWERKHISSGRTKRRLGEDIKRPKTSILRRQIHETASLLWAIGHLQIEGRPTKRLHDLYDALDIEGNWSDFQKLLGVWGIDVSDVVPKDEVPAGTHAG